MPKVKVNNTQGLVQATGGGLALFGATQSITVNSTSGADNPIAATTSLAIVTSSTANNHQTDLPAIADLDIGHTILIASIGTNDLVINTPGSETVNGSATISTGEGTVVLCVKSAADKWVAINVGT